MMQKMEKSNIERYPQENRLEAEDIEGAETFMEITLLDNRSILVVR